MGWFNPSQSTNGYAGQHSGYSSPGPVPGPARGILARLRQISSGWLGPKLSEGTSVAKQLRDEKAAGGPRGIFDLPWFLPYYDNYTHETASMRQAYRQMWADSNVKAACSGKIFSVAALELKFQPANKKDAEAKKHAEWCDYLYNERIRGGLPEMAWSILSGACTDGYSVSEKVWGSDDHGRWKGLWGIHALKPKDTLNDIVLQTDPYLNVTGLLGLRYNAGKEFSPADFVVFRHMTLYDQPTGMSDFRSPYKDYWMLDTAKKLRAIGVEKRAYPFILGQWKVATDQPGLEGQMARAKWQNWMSAPDTAKMTVLDMAGQGDRIFSETIKDLKHDIFLGIRGAILQSLEGTISQGRGDSQVHKETAELIDWYLASCLVRIFNDRDTGLIRDACDPNFICHEYPKATLSAVDLNELNVEAQIDAQLHTFLPLSLAETYERYNRTQPKDAADTIAPGGQGPAGMGGMGGMAGNGQAGGNAAPFMDINPMTARPRVLAAEGREASAHPFRFAEDWQAYLSS